jgi:AraC-like DNA-binding protein
LPEQQTGWLTGARDPIVGKSLGLLHSRVAHPWTIADLAEEVGISRSALVERFTRYLSEPPMTYLTRWRLQLARDRSKGPREASRTSPPMSDTNPKRLSIAHSSVSLGSRPADTGASIRLRQPKRRTHVTLMNEILDGPIMVADQHGETLDVGQNGCADFRREAKENQLLVNSTRVFLF